MPHTSPSGRPASTSARVCVCVCLRAVVGLPRPAGRLARHSKECPNSSYRLPRATCCASSELSEARGQFVLAFVIVVLRWNGCREWAGGNLLRLALFIAQAAAPKRQK